MSSNVIHETKAQKYLKIGAIWVMPALLALIPITIAAFTFWTNYSHSINWKLTPAKVLWAGELCIVEEKNGKNWKTHIEGQYSCVEAEEFVTKNNSLLKQLRSVRNDYVRLSYLASGAEQDVQRSLNSVARAKLSIDQNINVLVDPENPQRVDRIFEAAAEFKSALMWVLVGLVLGGLVHFLMKFVIQANDRKLAQRRSIIEEATLMAVEKVAAAGGSMAEQATAAAKAATELSNMQTLTGSAATQGIAGATPSTSSGVVKWLGIGIVVIACLAGSFIALGAVLSGSYVALLAALAVVGFGFAIRKLLKSLIT